MSVMMSHKKGVDSKKAKYYSLNYYFFLPYPLKPIPIRGMKKTIILGLFLAFAGSVQAQINLKSIESKAASTATGQEISNLLTSVESNIKPAAETTDFATKKTSWLDSAKKAATSEQGAALLSQLAGGLKSTSFGSGWAAIKDKWFASAKTTNTNSGLKTLASQLVSNLNTSSFTGANSKTTLDGLIGAIK
ncbi:MAG: hypothetical protein JWM14_306 [Chitinophagaceae bacterium]|nr:hypothetical protein [Chitinophagaceae bacterium]